MTEEVPDPIGGQAVLEGVMMRCGDRWAVAVRDPDGSVHVETHTLAASSRPRLARLPLVRGVYAIGDSLRLGYKALMISAHRHLPDDADPQKFGPAVAVAVVVFSALFFVLPIVATHVVCSLVPSAPFELVEGALRAVTVLGYVAAIGLLPHVRRTFEYHGAEHQTIAAAEAGASLIPSTAARFSTRHPRCGTAFLLWVLLVSVVVYAAVPADGLIEVVLSRVVGLPIIAGVAYEVIRFVSRHPDSRTITALGSAGLWLQRLTTRTPDESQLEVAIAAYEAVAPRTAASASVLSSAG